MDSLAGDELMTGADVAYLQAALETDPARRNALLDKAAEGYVYAKARYQLLDLLYYVPGEVKERMLPQGITRDQLRQLVYNPPLMDTVHTRLVQGMREFAAYDMNQTEREENMVYLGRAGIRHYQILLAQGKAPPMTQPTTQAVPTDPTSQPAATQRIEIPGILNAPPPIGPALQ
jgi:hypothetical protein